MNYELNVPVLNWGAAVDFIKTAVTADVPVMLHGLRGMGKSALVREVAASLGARLVDVRLSYYTAPDLRGVPQFGQADGPVHWLPPVALPFEACQRFYPEPLVLLFLDELFQAAEDVQKAAFQLVLDRRIGEHKLLSTVRIVAASNLASENAGAALQLDPLKNRFLHVQLSVDVQQWANWAKATYTSPLARYVIDFVTTYPEHFIFADEVGDRLAYPTPRTWEMLLRLTAGLSAQDVAGLRLVAAASVGAHVAELLAAFIEERLKSFDMAAVLTDPLHARAPQSVEEFGAFKASFIEAIKAELFNPSAACAALEMYLRRLSLELLAALGETFSSEIVTQYAAHMSRELDAMLTSLFSEVYRQIDV